MGGGGGEGSDRSPIKSIIPVKGQVFGPKCIHMLQKRGIYSQGMAFDLETLQMFDQKKKKKLSCDRFCATNLCYMLCDAVKTCQGDPVQVSVIQLIALPPGAR